MSNLKDQLIKLGTECKELRSHIRPVLAELNSRRKLVSSTCFQTLWRRCSSKFWERRNEKLLSASSSPKVLKGRRLIRVK